MAIQRLLQAALIASSLLSTPVLGGRLTDTRKHQEKRHEAEITKRHSHQSLHKRQDNSTEGFRFLNDNTARMLLLILPSHAEIHIANDS